MTTVARRTFRSSPARDAMTTWRLIVDLLTQRRAGPARTELESVAGFASSIIADQAPKDAPIIATCDGPRTRIYCVYDEDALDESQANEADLGFDPLNGDWHVSLPCQTSDLKWLGKALKECTTRVTVRDVATGLSDEAESRSAASGSLVLDRKGFLGQ